MRERSSDSVKIYSPRYRREDIIRILRSKVGEIRKRIPVKKIILFGSYAKNRYTVASDVDILVVYEERVGLDPYSIIWDIIDMPEVQLHIYRVDEYRKMRENLFIKEVERSGIVIWEE